MRTKGFIVICVLFVTTMGAASYFLRVTWQYQPELSAFINDRYGTEWAELGVEYASLRVAQAMGGMSPPFMVIDLTDGKRLSYRGIRSPWPYIKVLSTAKGYEVFVSGDYRGRHFKDKTVALRHLYARLAETVRSGESSL